jgi:hypothetical protein
MAALGAGGGRRTRSQLAESFRSRMRRLKVDGRIASKAITPSF